MATLLERHILLGDQTFRKKIRVAISAEATAVLREVPTAAPPVTEADKRLFVRSNESRVILRDLEGNVDVFARMLSGAAPDGQIVDNGAGASPRYTVTDSNVKTLVGIAIGALSREEFAWAQV